MVYMFIILIFISLQPPTNNEFGLTLLGLGVMTCNHSRPPEGAARAGLSNKY